MYIMYIFNTTSYFVELFYTNLKLMGPENPKNILKKNTRFVIDKKV